MIKRVSERDIWFLDRVERLAVMGWFLLALFDIVYLGVN